MVVEGTRAGADARVSYRLLDTMDEERGISAMARTTGFSLSIVGQMQASGRIPVPGVATPDVAVPSGEYIAELAKRGVAIDRRIE